MAGAAVLESLVFELWHELLLLLCYSAGAKNWSGWKVVMLLKRQEKRFLIRPRTAKSPVRGLTRRDEDLVKRPAVRRLPGVF
jgi:hypothetical protein